MGCHDPLCDQTEVGKPADIRTKLFQFRRVRFTLIQETYSKKKRLNLDLVETGSNLERKIFGVKLTQSSEFDGNISYSPTFYTNESLVYSE